MKALTTDNLHTERNSLQQERSSDNKRKKFPKIEDIDPDERPKTPPPQGEGVFTSSKVLTDPSLSIEKILCSAKEITELSSPIIKKLTLQKEQGITKTNFVIQTKRFDEVEIQITMYDTNPYRYHIRLSGNDEIRELSMKYQNVLVNQIKEAIPRIQVHVAVPVLREKDRFKTKKKISVVKTKSSCYGAVNRD
jgi:hypothetical protein